MANKGIATNNNIVIEAENEKTKVKGFDEPIHRTVRDLTRDENVLVDRFNKNYINIVEKTGIIPKQIRNPSTPNLDTKSVNEITKNYKNHPNIFKTKENIKVVAHFDFTQASRTDINLIRKSLNPKKTTSPDGIAIKVIKTAAHVTDSHLANLINKELKDNKFSENAKTSFVRQSLKNAANSCFCNFTDKILSRFISA